MYHLNNDCWFINLNTMGSHDLHSSHILLLFSRASAKADLELSSLSGVFLCVELGDPHTSPTPPLKWHIHWEFLDFKPGFVVHQLNIT